MSCSEGRGSKFFRRKRKGDLQKAEEVRSSEGRGSEFFSMKRKLILQKKRK